MSIQVITLRHDIRQSFKEDGSLDITCSDETPLIVTLRMDPYDSASAYVEKMKEHTSIICGCERTASCPGLNTYRRNVDGSLDVIPPVRTGG